MTRSRLARRPCYAYRVNLQLQFWVCSERSFIKFHSADDLSRKILPILFYRVITGNLIVLFQRLRNDR